MTTPPGGPGSSAGAGSGSGWPGPWMTVSDVFHIAGRGTVVTGQLEGSAPLNVGDTLVCDGARWEVSGIEQFRAVLTTALPGSNIGVLLRRGPAGDLLRDRTVTFEPGTPPGSRRKRLWHR